MPFNPEQKCTNFKILGFHNRGEENLTPNEQQKVPELGPESRN
jgi:hypothetical protein